MASADAPAPGAGPPQHWLVENPDGQLFLAIEVRFLQMLNKDADRHARENQDRRALGARAMPADRARFDERFDFLTHEHLLYLRRKRSLMLIIVINVIFHIFQALFIRGARAASSERDGDEEERANSTSLRSVAFALILGNLVTDLWGLFVMRRNSRLLVDSYVALQAAIVVLAGLFSVSPAIFLRVICLLFTLQIRKMMSELDLSILAAAPMERILAQP